MLGLVDSNAPSGRTRALALPLALVARTPRWLCIVAIVVVGAFVHYLALGNLVLRTHLLRGWLSHDEAKLKVDYASAWTAYPGHVGVSGLWLRYQDRNVQMLVELEHATVHIDARALWRRTIRFDRVVATGTRFRLRNKLESLEGNEGRVRAYPPIEGFADPPVEPKVARPPIPDDEYRLWTIELANVTASLRDVWLMEVRYEGEGTVSGGFHLRPMREVWVTPAVVVTRGGTFSLGGRELVRGGESRLDARLDTYDVRAPNLAAALRDVTAHLQQRGELASLAAIAATYLPLSGVELDEGGGPVAIDVSVERGVVQASSRVSYRSTAAVIGVGPLRVRGDLELVARVEEATGGPALVAEAVSERAAMTPAADIRGARLAVHLGGTDLAAPVVVARTAGAIVAAHVGDLRAWQVVLPEGATLEGGAATLAAHAEAQGAALDGRLDATLDQASMTIGTFAFTCSGKVGTDVTSQDVGRAVAFKGAKVDLTQLALHFERGHAEGLWLRGRLDKASAATSGALGLDAQISVEVGPGDRTVELFTRMASLPDIAADVTAGTKLDAALRLKARPEEVSLAILRAKDGLLEVRGRVSKRPGARPTGAFLMKVGPFSSGLDLHGGSVSVAPLVSSSWLEEKLSVR